MKYKIIYTQFNRLINKVEIKEYTTTAKTEKSAVEQWQNQFYNDMEYYFYINKVEQDGQN